MIDIKKQQKSTTVISDEGEISFEQRVDMSVRDFSVACTFVLNDDAFICSFEMTMHFLFMNSFIRHHFERGEISFEQRMNK